MSLLSSIYTTASALRAFNQALTVTSNNVSNSQTPGYAKQVQNLDAQPFDPASGLDGGVTLGSVQSTRNEFAEQAVERAQTSLGMASQQSSSLTDVQSALNLSAANGIPAALGNLFSSFSAWGQDPASEPSRQAVMTSAQQVVVSFQTTVTSLQQVQQNTENQIGQTVNQINADAQQLQNYNSQISGGDHNDASLDAKIHNTLESLSSLVNFTYTVGQDGEVTVLAGGQTPLVVNQQQYNISDVIAAPAQALGSPGVPPTATIFDSAGRDVTQQITGGQLGAQIDTHNNVLASLLGDANQPGSLNQLAQGFADRVNQLLADGNVSDGPPPVAGSALFSYDTTNATNVAATLAIDPSATPDTLAAIDPGPPYVSNGAALNLAALANPQQPADEINNMSYVQFFGNLAAGVGQQLSDANDQQSIQQQVVAQAQSTRQQISGVDLNEQAALLVQYQNAYQANAQLFTILNSLTQTAVNLLQPTG